MLSLVKRACSMRVYIISSVMHAFWLVLTYDLLEDRRIDDVIIKFFLNSLLFKTNRFQVAVRLFSNRLQRTSKHGKNISDTLGCASCATFLFVLTTFWRHLWSITWTDERQLGISLLILNYCRIWTLMVFQLWWFDIFDSLVQPIRLFEPF